MPSQPYGGGAREASSVGNLMILFGQKPYISLSLLALTFAKDRTISSSFKLIVSTNGWRSLSAPRRVSGARQPNKLI